MPIRWETSNPFMSYYTPYSTDSSYKYKAIRKDTQKISDGYEAGDRVKIRNNLKYPQRYGKINFSREMKRYRGKIVTIKQVEEHPLAGTICKIQEDGGSYYWALEMFEKNYL